jgi:hypothetical protein
MRRALTIGVLGLGLAIQPGAFADEAWEPSIYPEGQIFPSMLISTATQGVPEDPEDLWDIPAIGDPNGLVGALVTDVKKGDKIKVVVKANSLMEESTFSGTAPKAAKEMLVHPRVLYRYDALAKVRQQQPLNVSIETWVNGESLGQKTETVDVHSINDCLFGVVNDEGESELDAGWNFAAYVNENHPWVDEILHDALETGIVDSFDGYQSDNPEQVLLQIFAVWQVMQQRGMKYSSITTTATESENVLSQHVRLFDEAVKWRQANCVDGSVLLAGVLRKIGLEVFLVCVPGHMYLAVNLAEGNDDSMVGIETTMMGAGDLEDVEVGAFSEETREKFREVDSFNTFEAALLTGTADLEEHEEDFEDEENLDYQLVDISAARSEGIMPLAYSAP